MRFKLNRNADGAIYMTRQPSLEPRANLAHICCDQHTVLSRRERLVYIDADVMLEIEGDDNDDPVATIEVYSVGRIDGVDVRSHILSVRLPVDRYGTVSALELRNAIQRRLDGREVA